MTWRSSSRSKISPLHVTYVSIPSMSICFSCFTNCSTCSWLYGPKPPAPLPVEAAGPAEADPATPAGPVPPLLPVEAAGPTEVDPAAAGPVPVLPVEAAGGLLRPAVPRRKPLCMIQLGPQKKLRTAIVFTLPCEAAPEQDSLLSLSLLSLQSSQVSLRGGASASQR